MHKIKKKAFTLIELIIVIAIIAILAVTAFLVLTKWLGKSRDSRRLNDLSTIDNALQVSITEKGFLPKPDNSILIYASGTSNVVGYQGLFTNATKASISNINSTPIDPTDNTNYIYYVDSTAKYYQILGFTENTTSYATNTANAVDYSKRYIQTRGDKLGILLSGDNTPVNLISGMTGVDIWNTTGNYNAYFDNTNKLSGTGIILQWLQSNIGNGGAGFSSPTNCPIGFIPVPGNISFNQPGFCVAKYEMKQSIGDAGSWNGIASALIVGTENNPYCTVSAPCNNVSGGLTGKILGIVSKPEGYPIVLVNEYNAIKACESMGNGYHLVTNNERMTMARNIESNSVNWGLDKFVPGDSTLYSGINKGNGSGMTWDGTTGALPATFGEYGFSGGVSQNSFILKRTHKLSNGEIVRDVGGNVRELINGANTINGSGYNTMNGNICGNTTDSRFAYSNFASTCAFTGGYTYNVLGPSSNLVNSNTNGVGYFYSTSSTTFDKIYLRGGGHWTHSIIHGIYVLYSGFGAGSATAHAGFRCAR